MGLGKTNGLNGVFFIVMVYLAVGGSLNACCGTSQVSGRGSLAWRHAMAGLYRPQAAQCGVKRWVCWPSNHRKSKVSQGIECKISMESRISVWSRVSSSSLLIYYVNWTCNMSSSHVEVNVSTVRGNNACFKSLHKIGSLQVLRMLSVTSRP